MKTLLHFPRRFAIALIVLSTLATNARAQEKPDEKSAPAPSTPAKDANATDAQEGGKETAKTKPHVLPKGIEEIVRMSEAGVAPEVLTRYIENSGLAYEPTGADLIAMKQRGVPDNVTVVMLAKSAAIKAEYEAARKRIAAPAIVRSLSTDGQLDPESYEFFWYHYAYPRALAGSYQALAPYAQPLYYRSYRKDYGSSPKWRTDGFSRDSFTPGGRGTSHKGR